MNEKDNAREFTFMFNIMSTKVLKRYIAPIAVCLASLLLVACNIKPDHPQESEDFSYRKAPVENLLAKEGFFGIYEPQRKSNFAPYAGPLSNQVASKSLSSNSLSLPFAPQWGGTNSNNLSATAVNNHNTQNMQSMNAGDSGEQVAPQGSTAGETYYDTAVPVPFAVPIEGIATQIKSQEVQIPEPATLLEKANELAEPDLAKVEILSQKQKSLSH